MKPISDFTDVLSTASMTSPRFITLIIAEIVAIVAFAEAAVMFVLPELAPNVSNTVKALLDVALLTFICAPIIAWRINTWTMLRKNDPSIHVGRKTLFPVLAVLLVGSTITVLTTSWMHSDLRREGHAAFDQLCVRITDELERRMTRYSYGLKCTRGVFVASKSVERDEFIAYVQSSDLHTEFPGALGQGYIHRVTSQDLQDFIQQTCADNSPDFKVKTSGNCPNLYVIKYIEPIEPNRPAWGFDIGSETVCREGADRAMLTGQIAITGKIQLVQDQQKRTGFLVLLPVYRNGTNPQTPEERERDLVGWTYMPITAESALDGIADATGGLIDIEIFDGPVISAATQLYDADGHLGRDNDVIDEHDYADRMFNTVSQITVGGRLWTLRLSTYPQFNHTIDTHRPAFTAAIGTLLTLLLAGMVWSLGSARSNAIALAHSMTAELSHAKDRAEAAYLEIAALRSGLDQHAILSITDRSGLIIDVNSGFCHSSGYSRDELLGQDHRILNSGYHPKSFWTDMWNTIAAGNPWRGEVCNRAKNGSTYWVDSLITPILSSDGTVEKFVSIRFDISSKKIADQENARLAAIVNSTDDAIISKTLDGTITSWNRGAEILFGYTAHEAIGKSVAMLIPPERIAEDSHILSCITRGEMVHHFQTQRRRANASLVDIAITISPLRDDQGNIVGASEIARDISAQKHAEADLKDAREKAEAANASKSEFLANMSHEIRTPMTAILGFADLLDESGDVVKDPENRRQIINTIRKNGEHLLRIINDILDISKIEAGKLTVDNRPTDPTRILQEVMSLMSVKSNAKGLSLRVVYETPIPQTIQSDPLRLRQILVNLVGNAIKFTEVGSVTIHVAFDHSPTPNLRFDVIDTGIGLSTEQMSRIFGAFEQADSSVTRKHGGTGLGLRISKRLANMLGGDISIASTPNMSSTFTLTIATGNIDNIPLICPDSSAVTETTSRTLQPQNDKPNNSPLKGVRILLAEDGPDNQRLITFHLRKAGADVRCVENGRIAVEALTSDGLLGSPLLDPPPIDILLTDMQMPEMDGYTTAKLLRAKGFKLPIIALTAHAMSGDQDKCLQAGCDAYATKPIDKTKLIQICMEAFNRSRQSSNLSTQAAA